MIFFAGDTTRGIEGRSRRVALGPHDPSIYRWRIIASSLLDLLHTNQSVFVSSGDAGVNAQGIAEQKRTVFIEQRSGFLPILRLVTAAYHASERWMPWLALREKLKWDCSMT